MFALWVPLITTCSTVEAVDISTSRRWLLRGVAMSPSAAFANTGTTGLVLLPPLEPFRNSYWLVKAGDNGLDRIETNAARKMLNTLSSRGISEVESLSLDLENPLLFYSTERASTETAEILAAKLGVTRERMVPEYTLLDARGFGAHEGERLSSIPVLHEKYDARSRYLKPPEGEDGAYAECVECVFARVRQLMSKTETMFCGEQIVFVAPGDDVFSILVSAVRGRDLKQHFRIPLQYPLRLDTLELDPSKSFEPGLAWAEKERERIEIERKDVERLAYEYQRALRRRYRAPEEQQLVSKKTDHPILGAVALSGGLAAAAALSSRRVDETADVLPAVPVVVQQPPKAPEKDWGPCPVGDDYCLAVYTNQHDPFLSNIHAILDE